jgi:uncharacterized protein
MITVLAVSDMHGVLDNVFKAIELEDPDLLLCCGDWGDPGELDAKVLADVLRKVPVLSVFGNHDDLELLRSTVNEDGTPMLLPPGCVHEHGGLRIAGISGIWAKSHRQPFYVTDADVASQASELTGNTVDILLTHGCPVGLADIVPGERHGGQRCFLDAFTTIAPCIHLCGHLHISQMKVLKNGRMVVNVGYTREGDYWVLKIGDQGILPRHRRL